jgi:hypothetical protein
MPRGAPAEHHEAPPVRPSDRNILQKALFLPQTISNGVFRVAEGALKVTKNIASTLLHPMILLPALGAGALGVGVNRGWFMTGGTANFAGADLLHRAGQGVNMAAGAAAEAGGHIADTVRPVVSLAGDGVAAVGTGARNFADWARGV